MGEINDERPRTDRPMTSLRKPKTLKAAYYGVARIFEQLEECRKRLEAEKSGLPDPSDGLNYRDHLEALVRLEAQADALAYVFQMPRLALKKWIADMETYYRKLEAAA